jgi:hypothetical protein
MRFVIFSAPYHSEAHKRDKDTEMEPTELHTDTVLKKGSDVEMSSFYTHLSAYRYNTLLDSLTK